MEALLQTKLNFTTLTFNDEKGVAPTIAQVLGTLSKNVESLKSGDHFVFYFSGHLARVQDPENQKFCEAVSLHSLFKKEGKKKEKKKEKRKKKRKKRKKKKEIEG